MKTLEMIRDGRLMVPMAISWQWQTSAGLLACRNCSLANRRNG